MTFEPGACLVKTTAHRPPKHSPEAPEGRQGMLHHGLPVSCCRRFARQVQAAACRRCCRYSCCCLTPPRRPDHDSLLLAKDAQRIEYSKPNGVTTFDLPTSLYRSGRGFGVLGCWGFVGGQGSLHVTGIRSGSKSCWSLGFGVLVLVGRRVTSCHSLRRLSQYSIFHN